MAKINQSKRAIRGKIANIRKGLDGNKVDVLSALATHKLLLLQDIKNAKNILVYLPINNEVNTKFVINDLIESKKRLFLPVFDGKRWIIGKYSPFDKLYKGPFNIPMPQKLRKVNIWGIDVVILPGLAFSKDGVRVGYGKGVYDRLLAKSRCIKVGLSYDFQIVNNLPIDSHDILMDYVVTEKQILRIRERAAL